MVVRLRAVLTVLCLLSIAACDDPSTDGSLEE
jgi:hypothetical protein